MIHPSTSSLTSTSSCVEMSRMTSSGSSLNQLEGPTVCDGSLKRWIWGPFYYIAQSTGLVLHIDPQQIKTKTGLLHLIPNFIITVILLGYAIYTGMKISEVPFSINWAYSTCLFFFALHGAISSLVMMGYKFNNYFSDVINLLRKATNNNFYIPSGTLPVRIMSIFCFIAMMASVVIYAVDNFLLFPVTVTLPEKLHVPENDTQFFRKSMFGYQPLFVLDVIIKLYGMLVSGSCLFVYVCANGASCLEFSHFNTQLKEKIENKSILKLETIKIVESQLTDFLALIKFVTEKAAGIISISFVSGAMISICSFYAVKAFEDYLMFGKVTFYFWTVVSVNFLLFSCLKVGDFHVLLRETNDLLNLSHEIQKEAPDDSIRQIVRDMIERINTFDYGSKNMFSIKSGRAIFHVFMLIISFSTVLFVNLKYVPDFLVSVVKGGH